MIKKTKRTSVELLPGQLEAIQKIALKLGYVQKRGVGKGTVGSMAQLIQAIADGKLQIIKPVKERDSEND